MPRLLTELELNDALQKMNDAAKNDDWEFAHADADDILTKVLKLMGYTELVERYGEVGKWYA